MEILRSNEGDESNDLVAEMIEIIETVGSYMGFRRTQRKECLKLVRRLKLLIPLFEEIKEMNQSIPTRAFQSFVTLKKALLSAKKLLKHCNFGSKIFLVVPLANYFKISEGYLCQNANFFFCVFFFVNFSGIGERCDDE